MAIEHLGFKTKRVEDEWNSGRLCRRLVEVVEDLVKMRWERLGYETVITEIFRTVAENKALGAESLTHVEWRAADLHVDPTQLFAEMEIRVAMNKKWPTGAEPKMPRIPPLDHGTALHFHVQSPRSESLRKG